MHWRIWLGVTIGGILISTGFAAPEIPAGGELNEKTGLTSFVGCELLPVEWADGDSFRAKFPDGSERTLRLYGADCIEWHVTDDSDATRLRAQRRYFGLTGPVEESIRTAKQFGEAAAKRTQELLSKPFKVYTAFADGRGDERFQRVYAFVQTADGEDLSSVLVREGLARAYGVNRRTPWSASGDEYQNGLRDLELTAASNRRGVWKETNWDKLVGERQSQRTEEAELALAIRPKAAELASINPNTASRDELMSLPGVGETTAVRIIEARAQGPFRSPEDLRRVPGIGPKAMETLTPFLRFGS